MKSPVDIFGPPGIAEYWAGFMQAMSYDHHLRVIDDGRIPLETLVRVHTIDEGVIAFDGLRVRALRVNHPPVDHAFAYRFDGSKSVTFSGDTAYHPPLAAFAKDSDVLVHEALLPEGVEVILSRTGGGEKLRHHLTASHTAIEDVGRIAAQAGVHRLVLHHLVPVDFPDFTDQHWQSRAALHFSGPVTVGKDGLEIPL
jgi:ribonuclease BN (tRNA processing enzyme)